MCLSSVPHAGFLSPGIFPWRRRRRAACLVAGLLLAGELLAAPTKKISYDHEAFQIDGRDVAIYSGSMHYWRCAPGQWRDVLVKMKAAGINTVQTEVPWNVHEKEYGKFEFQNLEDFLVLCRELGLYVTVRVGPYIAAEWDNGGYPAWLVNRIPQRSYRELHPGYTKYCQHWYDNVLPVVKKHLITLGGTIIALQIENEYGAASREKGAVITQLYHWVRGHGIDIPIVTCNTPNAWANEDPVMEDIISGNNSHIVRFGTISRLVTKIDESRRREPTVPTIMLEMPAGQGRHSNWTNLGADEAVEVALEPLDFSQVNKTAWLHGAGLTNYYMFYGGTSFGYGPNAYGSTAYCGRPPVQAPMAEPSGLGAAYSELKLIGQWLAEFGPAMVRSKPPLEEYKDRLFRFHYSVGNWAAVKGGGKWPTLEQTALKDQGFVFLRDDEGVTRQVRFSYPDPITQREVLIPAEGYFTLPAREMFILNTNVELPGMLLKYSTSQIMARGKSGDRTVVVVYGPENTDGEVAFICPKKPQVAGAGRSTWDAGDSMLRINFRHTAADQHVVVDQVELVVLTKERAARSWKLPVGNDELCLISDAYFVRGAERREGTVIFNTETLPGSARFSAVLPQTPRRVTINGVETRFEWDEKTRAISFEHQTPALPVQPLTFRSVPFRPEDLSGGNWATTQLKSLEDMGHFESGYVRYASSFTARGEEEKLLLELFDGSVGRSKGEPGDAILVQINGKIVPELSGWSRPQLQTLTLARYVRTGENTLVVTLEKIGRPTGAGVGRAKGLKSVKLQSSDGKAVALEAWKWSRELPGQSQGFQHARLDDAGWTKATLGADAKMSGVAWYRLNFPLDLPAGWAVPLKLTLDVGTDAIIYLNGILIGRYNARDWQRDFFLPEPWLNKKGSNTLSIAVRSIEADGGLRKATVAPYAEYSVATAAIEIAFDAGSARNGGAAAKSD